MSFKFTPKAESEVGQSFKPLPPGEYPFTVIGSAIQLSKSEKNKGRPMCAVRLTVHGPDFEKGMFDYFADWFSEWKLKHFCETTGKAKDYAAGSVDPADGAWVELTGFVKIGKSKNIKTGEDDNEVLDYLPEEAQKVENLKAKPTDDVPF